MSKMRRSHANRLSACTHTCQRLGDVCTPLGTDLVVKGSESRLDSTEVAINDTASLVKEALEVARAVGVPTEGWGTEPIQLTPNKGLTAAIRATWPDLDSAEE